MPYTYIVFNPLYSKEPPIHAFDDYKELIFWVRKNKVDGFRIIQTITNAWDFPATKDYSQFVYLDAWNGFNDYRDENFLCPK